MTYLSAVQLFLTIGVQTLVMGTNKNANNSMDNNLKNASLSFRHLDENSPSLNTATSRHLSFMRPEAQNNSQITAQLGGKAVLSCYTIFIGDQLVIWLKRDEERLLTAGKQVYSSEGRYSIAHVRHQKLWELTIREVRRADEGLYECQLTSHPPVSLLFWLKVIEAKALIKGRKNIYINEGSSLRIHCHVEDATESIFFVFWFHDGSMINYKARKEVTIAKQHRGSILTIPRVTPSDAGVYRCEPYLARPDNVTVKVIKGVTDDFIGRSFFSQGSLMDASTMMIIIWQFTFIIFNHVYLV